MIKLIMKIGRVDIYEVRESYGVEFYVYGVTASGDPRVVPSLDMAREVADAQRQNEVQS
jgi:hypothetical protein